MKLKAFLFLLLFAASNIDAQNSNTRQAFTNVYHNLNNITLEAFDGTRTTIFVNGNSAILSNSDGTQSTINFFGKPGTLIAADGTRASFLHNGSTSIVMNSDGTQFVVNHRNNRSSCSTDEGIHVINHFFGNMKEWQYKDQIDLLIHKNWLTQKKAFQALADLNENKQQEK